METLRILAVVLVLVFSILIMVIDIHLLDRRIERWLTEKPQERRERRLREQLIAADEALADEYQQARRDMNAAAGQDWRNLAG